MFLGGSFALGGEGIGLGGEDSLSEADMVMKDVILMNRYDLGVYLAQFFA